MKKLAILLLFCSASIMLSQDNYQFTLSNITPEKMDRIYFLNANEGWISGRNKLFHTLDAGETWDSINVPIADELQNRIGGIYFWDSNTGIVVDNQYSYHTTDAGETWTTNILTTQDYYISTARGIYFNQNEIGVVYGSPTYFFSNDSGKTWHSPAQPPIHTFAAYYNGSKSFAAYMGFYGEDITYEKKDGGTTKKAFWWPGKLVFSYASIITSDSIIFTPIYHSLSEPSKIIKTDYHDFESSTFYEIDAILYDVGFADSITGFVIGKGGEIAKTTDQGDSWEKLTSLTTNDLWDIFFISADLGWIAGTNGTVIKIERKPIPVELTSFEGKHLHDKVHLNWKTATETNNSGFEIERSSDGNSFSRLHFIKGAGTSTEKQNYNYWDNNIFGSSIFYYRLNQVDFDGTSTYSKILTIEIAPKEFLLEQNYPNPFNPSTSIEFYLPVSDLVLLKVYDVLGNELKTLINETKGSGYYKVDFNADNLSSGVYAYSLFVNGQRLTRKMLLQK